MILSYKENAAQLAYHWQAKTKPRRWDEAKANIEAREFLKEQKKLRKTMMADLGIKQKEIETAYGLLEWCDAFSTLIFFLARLVASGAGCMGLSLPGW